MGGVGKGGVGWGRVGWGGCELPLLLSEGAARVRRGLTLCGRTHVLSLWASGSYFSQSPLLSPRSELLCAGQAAGLHGLSSVLENGRSGHSEGQSAEAVYHHELLLQTGV